MENRWDAIAKTAWQDILKKVKALSDEGMTLQQIADRVGVAHRSIISEWISGNRQAEKTSFANLMAYLERLGLDYSDYFPRRTSHAADDASSEGLVAIPVFALAGAGPGILPDQLEPLFKVLAPPEYFRRSNYAVQISGHSMEPLIPDGSMVGIMLAAPFQANELFLADIPYEGLVVKRVGVDFQAQEFIFKSQNPDKDAYPDFCLSIHEAEKIIIGRVVWVMRGY